MMNESMRLVKALGAIALVATAWAGCGRSDQNETTSATKIVAGHAVTETENGPERLSTVLLFTPQTPSICTATLIRSNVLLTAGHCVSEAEGKITQADVFAGFTLNMQQAAKEDFRKVTAIARHRDYNPKVLTQADIREEPMHDLALVYFEGKAPDTMKLVPLAGESFRMNKGRQLTLAGYGATAGRRSQDAGTLRRVEAEVAQVYEAGKIMGVRGPKLQRNALTQDPESGRWMEVPAHGGACAGDSGGPAYTQDWQGVWHIIGITSFGAELPLAGEPFGERFCIGENGFVDVRKYASVINHVADVLERFSDSYPKLVFNEEGVWIER